MPASAGLVLLATPVTMLLFEHGSFDASAVRQTAGMVRMFGLCGVGLLRHSDRSPRLLRGRRSSQPARDEFVGMVINLSLDLILMWPLGGPGLALATAISSTVQFGLVTWLFQQRVGRLDWHDLRRSGATDLSRRRRHVDRLRTRCRLLPRGSRMAPTTRECPRPDGCGLGVYFGLARAFKMSELALLFRGDASVAPPPG